MKTLKILVVDDEPLIAETLAQVLRLGGHEAIPVFSGEEAVERARYESFDLLLSDVMMPGISGVDAAIELEGILPFCKVVLISGNQKAAELLAQARDKGREFEILAKPIHPTDLLAHLAKIV